MKMKINKEYIQQTKELNKVQSYQKTIQRRKYIALKSILTDGLQQDVLDQVLPILMEQIKFIEYCLENIRNNINNQQFCSLNKIDNFTVFDNYLKYEETQKSFITKLNFEYKLKWMELRIDFKDTYNLKLINYSKLCEFISN